MAKQQNRSKVNIGSSSLILIFIVMCLVTFGVLSLGSAQNDWKLAQRNADAVTEYYRADCEGEAFFAMVKERVADACREGNTRQERELFLTSGLKQYYSADTGTASVQIAMDRSQALSVKLSVSVEGDGDVAIENWNVIQTENFDIDSSIPVWTGVQEQRQGD